MMRTMAEVPIRGTFLTSAEVAKISQSVAQEFPEDPALQAVYIARGIMREEAEQVGIDYFSYLEQLVEKVQ